VARVTLVDTTTTNTDMVSLSGIATSANVSSAQTAIITEVNANETKIDNLQTSVDAKPSLAQIEGSTIIAKEVTVASKSSQASVDAIPTNPLLVDDGRLDNLDTTISSRLASASYTAPSNSDITAIKTKTDQINFTGSDIQAISSNMVSLAGIATTTNVSDAQTAIIAEVNANESKIDQVSDVVDLLIKYNDNDTVFLAADNTTETIQASAYYMVVFDNDGTTRLKTISFLDATGTETTLANATKYTSI
jgi:hypothetical protein